MAASKKRLGVGTYSYMCQWKLARDKDPKAGFRNALEFLDHCHQLGADGVQTALGSREEDFPSRLRRQAEAWGMYFEGELSPPRTETEVPAFEAEVRRIKAAGASVARTALLSGRRYETFASADAFRAFAKQAWLSLTLAEPVVHRHRLRLAVENHKDWLAAEFVEMLRRLGSEHVGVCVDTGNNISLLEDPMEVVEALAPFAAAVHLKDMGVKECDEGFLLSEVPLGEGFLDLKKMVAVLTQANAAIQFSLEMITRDPLKVPCLTAKYWVTMESAPASRLASSLKLVRQNAAAKPLPRTSGLETDQQLALEEANIKQSLAFARDQLEL